MRLLFVFLIVALGTVSASAQSVGTAKSDVQELLGWCTQNQSDALHVNCVQYIAGVSDALWLNEKLSANKAILCPGGDAPYDARVQAFINWAANNPKRWNASRQVGVTAAIMETWPGPCKS